MAKVKKETKQKIALPLNKELVDLDTSFMNEHLGWDIPEYVSQNMAHKFRGYQEEALRYFHYSQVNEVFKFRNINHVLFNMATGSGKTDLMAGLILYLYREHEYQNFLFFVNTNSVLNKTIDNLTNKKSEKFLYSSELEIEGERITIERVKTFPKNQSKNTIYIKLSSVQNIASDIFTQSENSMGKDDYARNKVAILGDEAHHYSASTKSEKELEQSWEKAISIILSAREDNRLLEFTATIDLENKSIYDKYKDKVIYRYALDRFIQDRFSKNVKRIQSSNTDEENMLNVVLLSEFRRRYAYELYSTYVKPVIMFKSQRIDASNESNQKFNELIDSLTPQSIREFLLRQERVGNDRESETLGIAHEYYRKNDTELDQIVRELKREFAPNRIINANDSDRGAGMLEKGQYEALNSLESPANLYRVIFAVAKLTEGWDVLNLYDIVRISNYKDTKGDKKTTMAEAQLIGRGARYNPFVLNGKKQYTRRFDEREDVTPSLILETIHYHTINEPQYLKNLVEALNEMNLPTGTDEKNPLIDIKVKKKFTKTDVWKYGKVYYNQSIEITDDYYDGLDRYGIDNRSDIVIPWIFSSQEVGYKDNIVNENYINTKNMPIIVDRRYYEKAMNRLTFYHFDNLKKYLPQLQSKAELLEEKWLNLYNRTIYAVTPMSMIQADLTPMEKLKIIETYLLEVAQKIKKGYSNQRGTGKFIGYPVKEYITDYRKRVPNYDTSNLLRERNPQKVQRFVIEEDYFVYDSAIINLTEKQLVDRIGERVAELKKQYSGVYLIRMDENMHRESAKNAALKLHQYSQHSKDVHFEGFQPDFILYLQNAEFFVQVFIEPKGINLLEQDQWKEDLLTYINENEAELLFEDDVQGVKIKGLKFYTMNDGRGTMKQLAQVALGHDFDGLTMHNQVELQDQ
jgi:type III restriction enzyme